MDSIDGSINESLKMRQTYNFKSKYTVNVYCNTMLIYLNIQIFCFFKLNRPKTFVFFDWFWCICNSNNNYASYFERI